LKVMLAPDLHCFEAAYGQVESSTGQNSRFTEWKRLSEALEDVAKEKEVDVVIFPGDFFANARPLPTQVLAVSHLFTKLEEAGIRVVGYQGNHDNLGAKQISPCCLVSEIGQALGYANWAVDGSRVVEAAGINIATLPYLKISEANGDPKVIAINLTEMARALKKECDASAPNILTGHWSIEGAISSSEQVMGGNEPVIPIDELLALGYDAYLFGHIHKPQILNAKPFVGYSGALQRRDFGEERDSRGCYIMDLNAGDHEWVDLPAQEFITLEYPSVEALRKVFDDATLTAGKIARVKYRAQEGEIGNIDHGEIIKALEDAGAINIKGVFPEIVRSDRVRAEITEGTKPISALNKWLDTKGLNESLRLTVVAKAETLLDELQTIEAGGVSI
jgi:exonuclease SbcD